MTLKTLELAAARRALLASELNILLTRGVRHRDDIDVLTHTRSELERINTLIAELETFNLQPASDMGGQPTLGNEDQSC